MRLSRRVLLAVVLISSPALSTESFGDAALVVSRPALGEPYRFFAGRTVTVPLLIHTPESELFDIRADLVQVTSTLSVPVTGDLDVPLSSDAGARRWIESGFSLTVPAVNRETDFELRFRSRGHNDRLWQAAGRIALRAYPSDLLGPLRAWAESHPLRVEDDSGSLSQFLRRHQIHVAARSSPRGVTLYAGSQALQKLASLPLDEGETAVVFNERESETPHVLIDRTKRGTLVKIEKRLLDQLDTDPRAQQLLLEIFQHLHEQAPPMKGIRP